MNVLHDNSNKKIQPYNVCVCFQELGKESVDNHIYLNSEKTFPIKLWSVHVTP